MDCSEPAVHCKSGSSGQLQLQVEAPRLASIRCFQHLPLLFDCRVCGWGGEGKSGTGGVMITLECEVLATLIADRGTQMHNFTIGFLSLCCHCAVIVLKS
jgi:hypothetical protein